MHFSFAEQVNFLFFPLFWFQPPPGIVLPGTFLTLGSQLFMAFQFCWPGPSVLNGCVTQKEKDLISSHGHSKPSITGISFGLSFKSRCTCDGTWYKATEVQAPTRPQT